MGAPSNDVMQVSRPALYPSQGSHCGAGPYRSICHIACCLSRQYSQPLWLVSDTTLIALPIRVHSFESPVRVIFHSEPSEQLAYSQFPSFPFTCAHRHGE